MTIEELAYFKWMEAGCPGGDGVEFWLEAEAELEASSTPVRACEKAATQPRKVAAKAAFSRRK